MSSKKSTVNKLPKEAIIEKINKLPEKQQQAIIEQITVSKKMSYSGPVPPPDMLKEFNKYIPNGAERFMIMAEEQSRHRQEIDKKSISAAISIEKLGMILGFILFIILIGGAFALAYLGKEIATGIFLAPSVVAVIGYFINTSRK